MSIARLPSRQTALLAALLLPAYAQIVINEIHHSPVPRQQRGEFIELFNRSNTAVSLAGWRLSGGVDFAFTNGPSLPAGGYLVVAEDPRWVTQHWGITNVVGPWTGSLSSESDRLHLFNAGNQEVNDVNYERSFPWPTVGAAPEQSLELIHPSLDNTQGGHWRPSLHGPTPGARNSVFATNSPPAVHQVQHSPAMPKSGEPVTLSLQALDPDGVASVVLEYQIVEPGDFIQLNDPAYALNWIRLPMSSTNQQDFQITLPGNLQRHRRLIRYRFVTTDTLGLPVHSPLPDDPCPNFAYFVYDGVPAWTGAVRPGQPGVVGQPFTVPRDEMNRLPTFHLVARESEVLVATGWAPGKPLNQYRGDDYLWTGALVYDGEVYDHIHFRMRGGVWRYSMGKNAWKFDFNRGHELRMRDDYGTPYAVPWGKLSFRPDIQQGDYLHRGEQGLFESVGYRLFQLAGTDANNSVHVQFRIIDRPDEAPVDNQFTGDFWGKYLAVEEQEGRWLKERDLPDGNIFDMESGFGTSNHFGRDGPTDYSDLRNFVSTYTSRTLPESWWRTNLNLPSYFNYQIIVQGVHHYDIQDGKNYFYYRNGATGQWFVQPWDMDLTWADTMYRGGKQSGYEPFLAPVLNGFNWTGTALPNIRLEFRNRVREVRDLLFNSDQAWQAIDEQALLIHGTNGVSFTDADRAQWDYNPVMLNGSITLTSKAGVGRFYQKGVGSRTFAGMVQLMKNYVTYRATDPGYSLDTIALEPNLPATPALRYYGPGGFPTDQLRFASSSFNGAGGFGAIQYRIGEITRTNHPGFESGKPWNYEIQAVWESPIYTLVTPAAQAPPGLLQAGKLYRARVRHWDAVGRASHWSEPVEFTGGATDYGPPLIADLELSELQYAPAPGGYEYLELHNRSRSETLNLDGASLAGGIDFVFPPHTRMPPGAYLVVTRSSSLGQFRAYYNLPHEALLLGPYARALANGGDTVTFLTRPGGSKVFSVSYSAKAPWPTSSAGTGRSVVPLSDHPRNSSTGSDWRLSASPFGSPGRGEPDDPLAVALAEPPVELGQLQLDLLQGPGQLVLLQASSDLEKWQTVQSNLPPGRVRFPVDETRHYFRAVPQSQ